MSGLPQEGVTAAGPASSNTGTHGLPGSHEKTENEINHQTTNSSLTDEEISEHNEGVNVEKAEEQFAALGKELSRQSSA